MNELVLFCAVFSAFFVLGFCFAEVLAAWRIDVRPRPELYDQDDEPVAEGHVRVLPFPQVNDGWRA